MPGLFAICLIQVQVEAADPLKWLPAEVNAVARVNVGEIYQSPIAKKEGWLKRAAESFIQQESLVPPGTEQIVVGAELDLSDNLTARRKYSIIVPDSSLTLEKLAPWIPGGIGELSGKKMAQFGNDGYIVDAGDGCWLTTSSSSRQLIARWLKSAQAKNGNQLSTYLQTALKTSETSPQMILAIDLHDNFSAPEVMEQFQSSDFNLSKDAARNAADVIESIHGITLTMSVGTERSGAVTIDFGKEAAPLKPILDKLIEEVLDRVGVETEKLHEWKWTLNGRRISGSGPVQPGTGREILAILDPPSITHAISSNSTGATPEVSVARTSHKYSKSLQVLLDDLRTTLNREKHNHAVLFERYARKIDDLPKLNVDGLLLDFSGRVSSSLRYQGQSERMNKINAGTHKRQTYAAASMPGFQGNIGPYNAGWNPIGPADSPGVIDAQANQAAKGVRFSEWKQIEDGLVAIRRAMTEKYQLEF